MGRCVERVWHAVGPPMAGRLLAAVIVHADLLVVATSEKLGPAQIGAQGPHRMPAGPRGTRGTAPTTGDGRAPSRAGAALGGRNDGCLSILGCRDVRSIAARHQWQMPTAALAATVAFAQHTRFVST